MKYEYFKLHYLMLNVYTADIVLLTQQKGPRTMLVQLPSLTDEGDQCCQLLPHTQDATLLSDSDNWLCRLRHVDTITSNNIFFSLRTLRII